MGRSVKRKASVNDSSKTNKKKQKKMNRLSRKFFDVSCYKLANSLLGKLLVARCEDNTVLKGRIVETECYLGGDDRASNTFGGRRTPANEPMYMEAGTAFVYMTYGMYHCINISSAEPGAAVLLRALDPVEGLERMNELRSAKRKVKDKPFPTKELCNGPSKLCMSMNITKAKHNKTHISDSEDFWIETDPQFNEDIKVVKTARIGIESVGGEWAKKPLRFYILENASVSKRDIKAEENLLNE